MLSHDKLGKTRIMHKSLQFSLDHEFIIFLYFSSTSDELSLLISNTSDEKFTPNILTGHCPQSY